MKIVIDTNKSRVLTLVREIAIHTKKGVPTEEDLFEDNGVFYINININKTTVNKLPLGLQRSIFDTKEKDEILLEIKNGTRQKNRPIKKLILI